MFARMSHRIAEYLYYWKVPPKYSIQIVKTNRGVLGLKPFQLYRCVRGDTLHAITEFMDEITGKTIKVLERNVRLALENKDVELVEVIYQR